MSGGILDLTPSLHYVAPLHEADWKAPTYGTSAEVHSADDLPPRLTRPVWRLRWPVRA